MRDGYFSLGRRELLHGLRNDFKIRVANRKKPAPQLGNATTQRHAAQRDVAPTNTPEHIARAIPNVEPNIAIREPHSGARAR